MGSIYPRNGKLWLRFKGLDGKWQGRSTPFKVGQEKEARRALKEVERGIVARLAAGATPGGPLTLNQYAKRWCDDREKRGLASAADDRTRLKNHALKAIGALPIEEITRRHIRDLIRGLMAAEELAPRSIRHVYATLHTLFVDAVAEDLISANPCTLQERRKELPPKRDKDPTWRDLAIFTRDEVEALISDPRIPEDRRVLYALMFLLGVRMGEASALRWSRYDPAAEPLGRMLVAKSFSHSTKVEKIVKTENPRPVPVHPTLAKILAAWKLSGWERVLGRHPEADDLIIPSRKGQNRRATHALRRFHQDLALLGLRKRRQHDARRTFITLAQVDGALPHILKYVTHGPPRDIVSVYTSLPYAALCAEVVKLRISLRTGRVLALPKRAARSLL